MDVVYILGTGSQSGNQEIFYSLRSLERNMLDIGNVYVIGERPTKLPGVFHYPMEDPTKEGWKNAYLKTLFACNIPELSDSFLFMNDDFFLTEPFNGSDFPYYSLKDSNGGPCGPHSFHIHCPIVFNKEAYKKMPFSVDMKACKSARSLYANFYGGPPTFTKDFILPAGEPVIPYDEQIAEWPCFSIGDSAMLYSSFVLWLDEKYSEPSRFE